MKKHLFLLASLCVVLVSCDQTHRGTSSGTGTHSTDTKADTTNRGPRGTDTRNSTDMRDQRPEGTGR